MKTVTVSEETKEDLADIINSKPSISFDELCKKYGGETKENE